MIGHSETIPADSQWHTVGRTRCGLEVQRLGNEVEEHPLRIFSAAHDGVIWQGDMRSCRELIAALNTAYETKVSQCL
jgi:hypothetical protein